MSGFKLFMSIHSRGIGGGVERPDEQAISARGPVGAKALKQTREELKIGALVF